jgi:hypothetical protein
MAQTRPLFRHLAVAALLGVLMVSADILVRQVSHFRGGEQALAAGDPFTAMTEFESAIRMYVPGSPLVGKAAARIWSIADRHEAAGDREGALLAYRALRSAFYAVRSLVQPGSDWIARCDEKIATLNLQEKASPAPSPPARRKTGKNPQEKPLP